MLRAPLSCHLCDFNAHLNDFKSESCTFHSCRQVTAVPMHAVIFEEECKLILLHDCKGSVFIHLHSARVCRGMSGGDVTEGDMGLIILSSPRAVGCEENQQKSKHTTNRSCCPSLWVFGLWIMNEQKPHQAQGSTKLLEMRSIRG